MCPVTFGLSGTNGGLYGRFWDFQLTFEANGAVEVFFTQKETTCVSEVFFQ